jgi:hypothetical protein
MSEVGPTTPTLQERVAKDEAGWYGMQHEKRLVKDAVRLATSSV